MRFLRRLFRIPEPEWVDDRFDVFYNGEVWCVRDYDGLIEYPFSGTREGLDVAFEKARQWNAHPERSERYFGYRFTE